MAEEPTSQKNASHKRTGLSSRRDFLRRLAGGGALLLAGGSLLNACALFEDSEMAVGKLSDLPTRGFKTVEFNGELVALQRRAGSGGTEEVLALSLVCPHKACTVEFHPDKERFICPCHKGTFATDGQLIKGKPPHGLRRFQTEIRKGGQVFLLNREAGISGE